MSLTVCGTLTKQPLVVVHHLLNVLFWLDAQDAIFISEEVHSKVKTDLPSSFEFESKPVLEGFREGSRILQGQTEIIHASCNALADVPIPTHPNVGLSLAGSETKLVEALSKSVVPSCAKVLRPQSAFRITRM